MLDALTLDQLRVFLAVADSGSFSAAARRLRRAQSAISYAVANLEGQLGVPLFDRGERLSRLTEAGRALSADARAVLLRVDELRARARGLAQGLEAELALVVDVMFPMDRLTTILTAFRGEFPTVALRLHVEALGAVAQLVLDRVCRIGVLATLPAVPEPLERHLLSPVQLVPVAAPDHPLARQPGPVPEAALREQVQLVLTDRSRLTEGQDFAVFAARTWRLADLGAKHAFLLAGLGWGSMPEHMVRDDLAAGRLVRLSAIGWDEGAGRLPLHAIHRRDDPPGPAGRWLLDQLAPAPGGSLAAPGRSDKLGPP